MAKKPPFPTEEAGNPPAAPSHPLAFILENKGIFLMGCFGGMAPIIIQVANICQAAFAHDCELPSAGSFAAGIAAALLLGLVGGVVVCAMREREYGKAIFLGVSAPALILSALTPSPLQRNKSDVPGGKPGTSPASEHKKEGASLWNFNPFIATAHAQSAAGMTLAGASGLGESPQLVGRSVEVFSRNQDRTFNLTFYSPQNDELTTQQIEPAVKTQIPVPAGASYVRFSAGDSISIKYSLPKDSTVVADFFAKVTFQEEYSLFSFFTQTPKIVGRFDITATQRKKIDKGKEGWIYLGMYDAGRWLPDKRHTDLMAAPDKCVGKTATSAFENTHFRDKPVKPEGNQADNTPVLSLGQRLEILEVRQSEKTANAWWARAKILE